MISEPTILGDLLPPSSCGDSRIDASDKRKPVKISYVCGREFCGKIQPLTFQGYLENGRLTGPGKVYLSEGQIIEGTFSYGLFINPVTKHSKESKMKEKPSDLSAEIRFPSGNVFQGEVWEQSHDSSCECFSGKGKLTTLQGDTYMGTFLNGRVDGVGMIILNNGKEIRGKFKRGLLNGEGREKELGIEKKGFYLNGFLLDGTISLANRTTYIGKFDPGEKITGEGRIEKPDGTVYLGPFVDGREVAPKTSYTLSNLIQSKIKAPRSSIIPKDENSDTRKCGIANILKFTKKWVT